MDVVSEACSKSLGTSVKLEPTRGAGAAGGGGASVSAAIDKQTGKKYFVKSAPISRGGGKMLKAEYLGVKAMSDTNTIRVPQPIAYGEGGPLNSAFVVFEYLEMGGGGSQRELGRNLAKMHRCFSENNSHGFACDTNCGATYVSKFPITFHSNMTAETLL